MGETTNISWTDATFNPWAGCVKVSPACDYCYAERETKRYGFCEWGKDAVRRITSDAYWAQPDKWNREAEKKGVRMRVFCGSWCDVMEDGRPELHVQRRRLYEKIRQTPWLDWLLTTKRPQNFVRFLPVEWRGAMPRNIWCITTVETSDYLWRADYLKATGAVVKGLSIEPLLGDIPTIGEYLDGIDWVIVGGESGPHARPMRPDWARRIRDECDSRGIPFHFKQWGEHDQNLVRIGTNNAGRMLDGREWLEFPKVHMEGLT